MSCKCLKFLCQEKDREIERIHSDFAVVGLKINTKVASGPSPGNKA